MPHPRDYSIRIFYSREDGAFISIAEDFPGLSGIGDTREDALREIQLALESALEHAAESGVTPPQPNFEHA
jgi:predicted RNase H-like HicB family nuclease